MLTLMLLKWYNEIFLGSVDIVANIDIFHQNDKIFLDRVETVTEADATLAQMSTLSIGGIFDIDYATIPTR